MFLIKGIYSLYKSCLKFSYFMGFYLIFLEYLVIKISDSSNAIFKMSTCEDGHIPTCMLDNKANPLSHMPLALPPPPSPHLHVEVLNHQGSWKQTWKLHQCWQRTLFCFSWTSNTLFVTAWTPKLHMLWWDWIMCSKYDTYHGVYNRNPMWPIEEKENPHFDLYIPSTISIMILKPRLTTTYVIHNC
jgi:hypothetical protein